MANERALELVKSLIEGYYGRPDPVTTKTNRANLRANPPARGPAFKDNPEGTDNGEDIATSFTTLVDQVGRGGFQGWIDNGYADETAYNIEAFLDQYGGGKYPAIKELKEFWYNELKPAIFAGDDDSGDWKDALEKRQEGFNIDEILDMIRNQDWRGLANADGTENIEVPDERQFDELMDDAVKENIQLKTFELADKTWICNIELDTQQSGDNARRYGRRASGDKMNVIATIDVNASTGETPGTPLPSNPRHADDASRKAYDEASAKLVGFPDEAEAEAAADEWLDNQGFGLDELRELKIPGNNYYGEEMVEQLAEQVLNTMCDEVSYNFERFGNNSEADLERELNAVDDSFEELAEPAMSEIQTIVGKEYPEKETDDLLYSPHGGPGTSPVGAKHKLPKSKHGGAPYPGTKSYMKAKEATKAKMQPRQPEPEDLDVPEPPTESDEDPGF